MGGVSVGGVGISVVVVVVVGRADDPVAGSTVGAAAGDSCGDGFPGAVVVIPVGS